jgi:hypothetical protein
MKRTVYRATNPPLAGGKEYYKVKDTKSAILLTKDLNTRAKKKDYVWA